MNQFSNTISGLEWSNVYQEMPIESQITDVFTYSTLTNEARNEMVIKDFLNLYETTIESLETNKDELYNIYQNRMTDFEFLNVYAFRPVLIYAKYIEDNRELINQIDQQIQDVIAQKYPDLNSNPRYFVSQLHVETFILIATNLYSTSPTEVDNALNLRS